MIRRPPRSTQSRSSAASDVYKRQIVAGVAQGLVTGTINWQTDPTTGLAYGMIPRFIQIFQTFTAQQLLTAQGLAFFLFRGDILAAISTIAIFAIVVYVETTRIEIPLAHSSVCLLYTHLRAHETRHDLVCRLLLEKK